MKVRISLAITVISLVATSGTSQAMDMSLEEAIELAGPVQADEDYTDCVASCGHTGIGWPCGLYAGAEAVILFPVLHEHCGNRQPLVPQQQGCDSRINAAGQGYHNQSSMVRNCIHGFLNGDSVPIKKSPQAFR